MISKMDNGNILLEMGKGTLFSSVVKTDENQVVGICFSNSSKELKDGVIFKINSIEGIVGYIRPLVSLFEVMAKTSTGTKEEREKLEQELASFKEFIEPYLPLAKSEN